MNSPGAQYATGEEQRNNSSKNEETEPDLFVSVQESLVEVWVDSSLLWGQGH